MSLTSAPIPAITDGDHVRGPEDAPLIVLYADFTCPRCVVARERLRDKPLRVVFRHFALNAKHPRAVPLAQAAEAAALQDAFWPFHDALYDDPGRIDDPHLWARAERLGLDLGRFDADRRSAAVAERVTGDVRAGMRAGVALTPTLVAPDGAMHPGAPSEMLLAAILGRASEQEQ